MRNAKSNPGSQRGAVLIVALVLLLVLTILGTASIQDTTMEERMAGNFRDLGAALEAAESTLRNSENFRLADDFGSLAFDGTDGSYDVTILGKSVDPRDDTKFVGIDTSIDFSGQSVWHGTPPDFYLEQLPEILLPASDLTIGFSDQAPRVTFYRTSSMGFGISPNTEVILQSTYLR